MTTNLKLKRGSKSKKINNEQWFSCTDCGGFCFTLYQHVKSKSPFCPNCGEMIYVIKTEPRFMNARETYRLWEDKEMPVIEKVLRGEIFNYQAAIELDRSIHSVEGKVRRERRKRGL